MTMTNNSEEQNQEQNQGQNQEQIKETSLKEDFKTIAYSSLLGLGCIVASIYSYIDYTEWERTGGTREVNSTVHFFIKYWGRPEFPS